ncbi:MAG: hypothetical protein BWY81_01354 [Firmicutes bacterium ADurb.Bin467]|nr:MAG: hypothetical protein BWY81_01354 [Firmicutes bacterium ADurb.Bin467]
MGRIWESAISTNRLRSEGPSFTSCKSSGENSTPVTWPINSPERRMSLPLTLIFRRPAEGIAISTVCEPSMRSASILTRQNSSPHRINSRSCRVLCERPAKHRWIASSRFVLPCALSPVSTVTPAQG